MTLQAPDGGCEACFLLLEGARCAAVEMQISSALLRTMASDFDSQGLERL